MEQAVIIAAGQTKFGDRYKEGIKELFAEAYQDMLDWAPGEVKPNSIQAAYVGTMGVGGMQLGQSASLLTGHIGLPYIPAVRIENACASGGFAFYQAVMAVESGKFDLVLAGGVEKMCDLSGSKVKYWLGVSGDNEYERLAGLTFAGIYAIMATRYMEEYGMEKKYLSLVALKNHKNGSLNPKAHFQREISLEKAMAAANVAFPLNLFDCSPISDGAAVVLVASRSWAEKRGIDFIRVLGTGAASDYLAIHDRDSMTGLVASQRAAAAAYEMAGLGPEEIDLFEIHDCFTIAEIMAYEDLGLAEKGRGWLLLKDKKTFLDGQRPVNTSGGLKAKGHPLGATGISQVGEIFLQLMGRAGARQVEKARIGLTHNVGGSGGTAVVSILGR